MTLGEKLKNCRLNKGLSQEKIAEIIDVSRQAVTKWESNQTVPSSANLIALASIYDVSLDELAYSTGKEQRKDNKILKSNLTRLAIVLHAAALNACIQPTATTTDGVETDVSLLFFQLSLLLACSIWMLLNLRYEKNIVQYRKNVKIELLYCMLQAIVAVVAFYSRLTFLGSLLIIIVALIYLLVINPKYLNRPFAKKKTS